MYTLQFLRPMPPEVCQWGNLAGPQKAAEHVNLHHNAWLGFAMKVLTLGNLL